MRVVHVAISNFYIEGWGYQENFLPKYHKRAGHDVYMITSRFDKDEQNKPCIRPKSEYVNKDGIKVSVLDYAKPNFIQKFFRLIPIEGFYEKLSSINPDVIFVHGGGSCTSKVVYRYKINHPNVRVFADQHGDYYNTPVKKLKNYIYIKYVVGHYVRMLAKITEKYWGVTPWRVDFLQKIYGLAPKKTDLLVMGADDELIKCENRSELCENLRNSLGISPSSFLIVTGGKIDHTKNVIQLIKAVNSLSDEISLVIFGSISNDIKDEITSLVNDNPRIHLVNWLNQQQIIEWLLSADLAIFPGTHSVIWEQCVACGTPIIVKDWEGMHHIDIGGNCKFVQGTDVGELKDRIQELVPKNSEYNRMLKAARSENRKQFYYSEIAKKAINDD